MVTSNYNVNANAFGCAVESDSGEVGILWSNAWSHGWESPQAAILGTIANGQAMNSVSASVAEVGINDSGIARSQEWKEIGAGVGFLKVANASYNSVDVGGNGGLVMSLGVGVATSLPTPFSMSWGSMNVDGKILGRGQCQTNYSQLIRQSIDSIDLAFGSLSSNSKAFRLASRVDLFNTAPGVGTPIMPLSILG